MLNLISNDVNLMVQNKKNINNEFENLKTKINELSNDYTKLNERLVEVDKNKVSYDEINEVITDVKTSFESILSTTHRADYNPDIQNKLNELTDKLDKLENDFSKLPKIELIKNLESSVVPITVENVENLNKKSIPKLNIKKKN